VLGEARSDPALGAEATYDLLRFVEQRQIGGLYLQMGTIFGGRHQFHLGRLDRARVMLQNALRLAELTKIGMGIGWARAFLGDVHFVAGSYDEARAAYEGALEIGNQRSDEYAAPLALSGLCHLEALTSGDPEQCRRFGDEALERFDRAHNRTAKVHCLQRYAEALHTVDVARSRRLLEQRDGLVEELGADPQGCDWWPRPPDWLWSLEPGATRELLPVSARFPSSSRAVVWRRLNSEPPPLSTDTADSDLTTLVDESGAPIRSTLIRQLSTAGSPLPEFASK
jgi:tetratricopeptide (TPR) repeat protein